MARAPIKQELHVFKKDRIRDEAERLFYERGFSGTSMDAIAESMHATKPFIYAAYASKADILFDIHLRVVESVFDAVEAAHAEDGSPAERLASFARRLTTLVLENQAAVAVFFREEGAVLPKQLKKINDLKGRIDDRIAALLDAGVAAGELELADTRTAALAIGGMISWTYTWFRPTGRLAASAIADDMAAYALRIAGLKPATPPKPAGNASA